MSSANLILSAVACGDAYAYKYLTKAPYDELILGYKCATQDAKITVDAAFDGSNFDVALLAETTITAAAAMVTLRLTERYPTLRVGYKNAAPGVVSTITVGYAVKEAPKR